MAEEYIQPELLVIIPVLNAVGTGLKKSKIKDEYIPTILGGAGVTLSALYLCSTKGLKATTLFAAITQGILCASASVYVNQLVKQRKK